MSPAQIVLAIVAAWTAASVVVALWLGRALKNNGVPVSRMTIEEFVAQQEEQLTALGVL